MAAAPPISPVAVAIDASSRYVVQGDWGRIILWDAKTFEPQFMDVSWNDVDVGRSEMRPEWADYRFHVPAGAVRPGTNTLGLRFDRAPVYHRVRGAGPREVRPAAVSTLTLHRDRE